MLKLLELLKLFAIMGGTIVISGVVIFLIEYIVDRAKKIDGAKSNANFLKELRLSNRLLSISTITSVYNKNINAFYTNDMNTVRHLKMNPPKSINQTERRMYSMLVQDRELRIGEICSEYLKMTGGVKSGS